MLLGVSNKHIQALGTPEQAKPLIEVESPASGMILTRSVNPGEVVMTGKELFRVADLSSVWVMGQIYEKDFAAVRVGTPAVLRRKRIRAEASTVALRTSTRESSRKHEPLK